jgi:restriction system protein
VLAALAREPEGLASSAILDAVPSSFPHLSPAALALRTPDGRDKLLRYNAMWARQFLEWRGLIRKVRRRVYAITPEGMALIGRAAGSDGSVDLTALAAHFKTRPNRPVSAEGSPGGATAASKRAEAVPAAASGEGARRTDGPAPVRSFADAAEFVLDRFGGGQPMHYRAITRKALELGLVVTRGRTPEQTLYAQVLADIDRRERSGEPPRFVRHGRGMVALSRSVPVGLAAQIERHNARVREQLHARMLAIPPGEFETLVGELLAKLGFQDVEVTARSGDGGIDVRGTLVVGEVIRTRMAVQVKRWRANNVQAPTVQQVRGSLGTHDQGLIITTSDFSAGARTEAERPNAVPVALMNGTQLVDLLIQEGIGIRRASYELIDLEEGAEGSDAVTQDARRGAPGR